MENGFAIRKIQSSYLFLRKISINSLEHNYRGDKHNRAKIAKLPVIYEMDYHAADKHQNLDRLLVACFLCCSACVETMNNRWIPFV